MKWLHLNGLAETPISLPRRAEAGNLYETLPEIPGTALRGAFAGKYIRYHGWNSGVPDDDEGEKFEKLFENLNVRFGPLRPIPDGLPEGFAAMPLPVPRSARSCKYEGGFASKHGVFDSLLFQSRDDEKTADPKMRECPSCGAPLEAIDNTWMVANWNAELNSGKALDYDPVFRLNTHVGIGPAVGEDANLSDEARLFSLQHFPAGTRFRGWIAVKDSEVNQTDLGFEVVDKQHEIMLRVGRRSRSYGALKVWIDESYQFPWESSHGVLKKRFDVFQKIKAEIRNAKLDLFNGDDFAVFSLTCVTDLILLDTFLRPCRAITNYQMAERLSLNESDVQRIGSFTGTRLISGWNAAHRLPKENDYAITAGSVFLFAVRKNVWGNDDLLQKLADIENTGIGWRRSEGFGQVLICDPFHVQGKREEYGRSAVKLDPLCLSKESDGEEKLPVDPNVWSFLVRNADMLNKNRSKITKTQINSLRDRVQRYNSLSSDTERKRLLSEYLKHAEEKSKQARAQLEY